ncbi:MAG: DUF6340 family protein [Salinivirgaceae bacterium]
MKKHTVIQLRKLFFFLSIAIAFAACRTVSSIKIEVVKPASVILPDQVSKVLVINNWSTMAAPEFTNSFQKAAYQLDTTASQQIIKKLVYELEASPRLDSAKYITEMFFRQPKDQFKQMEWTDVDKLCHIANAQAMISLDGFSIVDSLLLVYYDYGYGIEPFNFIKLTINSLWRVYYPEKKEFLLKWWQTDELELPDVQSVKQYYELIDSEDDRNWLVDLITDKVALNTSDKLVPYWLEVERYLFYTTQPELNQANNLAFQNEWINAALIWKKFADNKNATIASSACHNMAVVCEVEGKLDLALEWAEKSLLIKYNSLTSDYINDLRLRIEEIKLLNHQFGL